MSDGHEHPVALSVDGQPALFPTLPYKMHDRAEAFMHDEQIQRFVNQATLNRNANRQATAHEVFGDKHSDLRALAGSIKQHTLDHLDHYIEQFIDNATAAGVQVHFAKDAKEANAICVEIARQEKSTACVKSKSMVTEETHLLPELEAIGVDVLETDLGEFILQIDGDAPSHIVTPMIHKDRIAVAKAFQRELGARYTEDPAELTMIAREHLREKFRQADLGISGGNFLVAETGSIVLCTNEGNGRLCTTVPRVHVAFVGIEKLVPTYEHLTVLLKLLARTSTAQPLTVYTHVLTGPKRAPEHDGPEKMHIILIDNGRTNILRDTEYREALRCIRCGACLNACPVYRKVTGHAYGAVYSGPIGAVITPLFKGLENYKDLPGATSLCGACYEACPVKINLPEMLIKLRRDMLAGKAVGRMEKLAYKMGAIGLKGPLMYSIGGWFQRVGLRLLADKDGYVRKGPSLLKNWTSQRDLPAPAAQNFRTWWKQYKRK
ncbi:iron-sulfur cluster-binding protein [Planctomycetales bacterium ZRK34]|nr:iron-sulfur cluster-binding protein [Planctomycetales bacterium ZRK34]